MLDRSDNEIIELIPEPIRARFQFRKCTAGGMGHVFEAWDENLQRRVAIKVPKHDVATVRERFQREARLAARVIKDANQRERGWFVDVYEYVEDGKCPCLITAYLDGQTLGALLRENGALPLPIAVGVIEDLCNAVALMRKLNIAHRDLKPDNLFVLDGPASERLSLKILDFGIAVDLNSNGQREQALTRDGAHVGTPGYMPLPWDDDLHFLGEWVDVHQLGLLLFELLAGKPAFDASDNTSLREQKRGFAPGNRLVDMSPAVASLIAVAMGSARPPQLQTVAVFRDRLADLGPSVQSAVKAVEGVIKNLRHEPIGEFPRYAGMRPFSSELADDFFGRRKEQERYAELLRAPDGPQVLHLKGGLGSGKSSLVRAGILPLLTRPASGRPIRHLSIAPKDDPFEELADQIISHDPFPTQSRKRLADRLFCDPEAAFEALDGVLPLDDTDARRVLFVDQLEELLLLDATSRSSGEASAERKKAFAELMCRYVKRSRANLLITTVRSEYDHLLELMEWRNLGDVLGGGYRVYPPEIETSLEEIVRGPAERVAFTVEDRLIEALKQDLHELKRGSWLPVLGAIIAELSEAWHDQPREQKRRVVAFELYRRLNRRDGVIRKLTRRLVKDLSIEELEHMPQVFALLVRLDARGQPTKNRIRLSRSDESPEGTIVRGILERCIKFYLVNDESGLEIAHDVLFTEWPELADWIVGQRDDLIEVGDLDQRTERWREQNRRREDLLPEGARLEAAERFLSRHPILAREAPDLKTFVALSRQECTRIKLRNAIERGELEGIVKTPHDVVLAPDQVNALMYPAMYYAIRPQELPPPLPFNWPYAVSKPFESSSAGQSASERPSLAWFNKENIQGEVTRRFTIAHFATVAGHIDVLERLWALGQRFKSRSVGGTTPFLTAVYGGHLEAVEWVYEHASKRGLVSKADREGRTPLHWAASRNHESIAKWLFERGADPRAIDDGGLSPLHYAATQDSTAVARLLLRDPRVDPNQADGTGRTALHLAAEAGATGVIKLLLGDFRVDVNAVFDTDNQRRMNALHWAIARDQRAVVEELLASAEFDATAKTDSGRGALHFAAQQENPAILRLLLNDGRFKDEPDHEHATAFGLAQSNPEALICFVEAGHAPPLWTEPVRGPGGNIVELRPLTGDDLSRRITSDLTVGAAPFGELPPLVAGSWQILSHEQAQSLLLKAAPTLSETHGVVSFECVRCTSLSFYGGATLFEIQARLDSGDVGCVEVIKIGKDVTDDNQFVFLTGASSEIHYINDQLRIKLSNTRNALDYLRFFTAALQGDESTFRFIEDASSLLPAGPSAAPFAALASPAYVTRRAKDFHARAIIKYRKELFKATFSVSRKGIVTMLHNKELQNNIGMHHEVFVGGVRRLSRFEPNDGESGAEAAAPGAVPRVDENSRTMKGTGKIKATHTASSASQATKKPRRSKATHAVPSASRAKKKAAKNKAAPRRRSRNT